MTCKDKTLRITAFAGFLIFLSTFSLAVSLEAGEISETDITRTIVSDRWVGISGEVYRSNETIGDPYIEDLTFNSSQGGKVVATKLEGIRNGGYYLAFLPENRDIQLDQLYSVNSSELEKNGLFSQELYPSFYPNYSQYYDNPENTFEEPSTIQIEGEKYKAFEANLSGRADTYVLRYGEGEKKLPIIFSPIDGLERESMFKSCYVEDCNFQTLLPALGNSSYSYSTYLFPRGNSVSSCGEITSNSTNLLMNDLEGSGEDCLRIENVNNTHLDFYNSHVENSDSCGLTVTGSRASVSDLTVQDHNTGICIEDSNVTLYGGSVYESTQGLTADSSNINLHDVNFAQNALDANLGTSNISANNLTLGSTSINIEGRSIGITSVDSSLPRPSKAGQNQLSLDLQFEINERAGNPAVTSLGVSYPINASSEFKDMYLYKYDDSANSSYDTSRLGPLARRSGIAWYNETIESFSSFKLYGEEAGDEDSQENESSEGSQGGGGSGSGGGFVPGSSGGGITDFDPSTEIPEANLTIEPENYDALRGETISVDFRVNNTGNVSIEGLEAGLTGNSFPEVPREFQSLNIGEVRQGRILVTVPEDIEPGNRSLEAGIQFRNLTLDTAHFNLSVSEMTQERNLNIVEAPSFVSLSPNETRSIGFFVENPTNRDLEEVEVSIRGNNNCVSLGNETFDFSAGEQKNIQTRFYTIDQEKICNSVVVFSHEEDILGYNPMRIVVEDAESDFEIPIYVIITVVWSSLLVYRVMRNRRGE